MSTVTNPLSGLIEGLLQGHALGQQLKRQQMEEQAFKTNQALHEQQMSIQDIMNRQMLEQNAVPVNSGTVEQRIAGAPISQEEVPANPNQPIGMQNLPTTQTRMNPLAGTSYLRPPDKSRTVTYKDSQGNAQQYELLTPEEQMQKRLRGAQMQSDAEVLTKGHSDALALRTFGKEPSEAVLAEYPGLKGQRFLPGKITELEEKAAAARQGRQKPVVVGPGGAVWQQPGAPSQAGGTPAATGAPGTTPATSGQSGLMFQNPPLDPPDIRAAKNWYAALIGKTPDKLEPLEVTEGIKKFNEAIEKPRGDFERSFAPAFALKHGLTPEGLKKNPDLTLQAMQEYAQRSKDPTSLALAHALTQAHIDDMKARASSAPVEIEPGTKEFRTAQDLAYGKLTMSQFRLLYSSRGDRGQNMKTAMYDKARELNPNFNPATFEMGNNLAKNPKVQQQLASMDNVTQGIPDLIKLSDAASRSGATMLNKFIIPGGVAVGSKKFSNFHAAQIAFADELSGALGFGSATDMSRQMGLDMTNPSLSPENFKAALTDVVMPFIDRKRGTLLKQMGVYGEPGMNPAAPAASVPGVGAGISVTAPDGSVHTFSDQAGADKFKSLAGMK